jgi:lipopolysaccharide export system permease protein
VIKKLDKLIIGAFIGPFIATFLLPFSFLYYNSSGSILTISLAKAWICSTIGTFILYVCATLVPLALPLTVLLSSIMTFGNLGETFELVAIKSAGIPLLRFMRPLFVCSIFICGIAYMFNNYIIPVAQLKMQTLKYDIIVSNPHLISRKAFFMIK